MTVCAPCAAMCIPGKSAPRERAKGRGAPKCRTGVSDFAYLASTLLGVNVGRPRPRSFGPRVTVATFEPARFRRARSAPVRRRCAPLGPRGHSPASHGEVEHTPVRSLIAGQAAARVGVFHARGRAPERAAAWVAVPFEPRRLWPSFDGAPQASPRGGAGSKRRAPPPPALFGLVVLPVPSPKGPFCAIAARDTPRAAPSSSGAWSRRRRAFPPPRAAASPGSTAWRDAFGTRARAPGRGRVADRTNPSSATRGCCR